MKCFTKHSTNYQLTWFSTGRTESGRGGWLLMWGGLCNLGEVGVGVGRAGNWCSCSNLLSCSGSSFICCLSPFCCGLISLSSFSLMKEKTYQLSITLVPIINPFISCQSINRVKWIATFKLVIYPYRSIKLLKYITPLRY